MSVATLSILPVIDMTDGTTDAATCRQCGGVCCQSSAGIAWPEAGQWDNEPDFRQWIDPTTGLPCLIVRNRQGALCGYVGVSKGHPAFEKDYNDVDLPDGVHGGLTYADHCGGGICHTVEAGEDDNVWWLGFDCLHAWDAAPGFEYGIRGGDESYKDIRYVTGEVESLARQLKAAASC